MNEKDIVDLAIKLHATGVDLEHDDNAAEFLGDYIEQDCKTGFLDMIQKSFISSVLQTLNLNVGTANGKFIPTKVKPLTKHVHGEPVSSNFNYNSVVGILVGIVNKMLTKCCDILVLLLIFQKLCWFPTFDNCLLLSHMSTLCHSH